MSIWASRSSCALGTTGGGPLQTFPWWLAFESLQTFGAVFYHKRYMRSFKAGRWILHDIQNFEETQHLILCDCICRVNQSKSLRQQHKSSEALRFCTFTFPMNWHRQIMVRWMGEATKAEVIRPKNSTIQLWSSESRH